MNCDHPCSLNVIIQDLDTLILELEHNPQLSSWVVHQILKSIKEKAKFINDHHSMAS